MRLTLDLPEALPGIVIIIHNFGEYLDFHPHLHALVADGLSIREGTFHVASEANKMRGQRGKQTALAARAAGKADALIDVSEHQPRRSPITDHRSLLSIRGLQCRFGLPIPAESLTGYRPAPVNPISRRNSVHSD